MTIDPKGPLAADHFLVGTPCRLCNEPFLAGERPCLLPASKTDDPLIVEAAPAHWTCHVVTERFSARITALWAALAKIEDELVALKQASKELR